MGFPNPGTKLNLTVTAAFPHHPGKKNSSGGKSRGKGKPSLELILEALPMDMQLKLNAVVPKGISVIDRFSPLVNSMAWWHGVRWTAGTLVQTVLDTGASRCVMSSDDAIKAFSTTLNWSELAKDTVTLPNGDNIEGRKVWMRVQMQNVGGPFYMCFLISDTFESPVLISWRAIRKKFRFVLAVDHMVVCE